MKKIVGISILVVVLAACGSANKEKGAETGLADFTLQALDGTEVNLTDSKGQVVIIDFWATWCPPCRNSIPTFIRLHEKYSESGLVILGIGLDDEPALQKFAKDAGIPYLVLVGNNDIAKAYGVTGIPKTIFVDKKGKIRKTQVGFAPELEASFDTLVDSLLSE
mgnify:CR=1 FL=1